MVHSMLVFTVMTTLLFTGVIECSSLTTTLTLLEQHNIAKTLQAPPKDLPSLYYSVTALKAISQDVVDKEGLCAFAAGKVRTDNALSLMQYSTVSKVLECAEKVDVDVAALVTDNIEAVNLANLVITMGNLGLKVDEAVVKKFVALAKDNDTPNAAAASFLAASTLPKDTEGLAGIVSMAEDVVAQADEINNEFLQYEAGLALTSKVVTGILALGDAQGVKLLKDEQAIKFAQYFVNRKYVHAVKDIHHLLLALTALSTNTQSVPVVVSVFRSSLVTAESPALKVRVTNLIDQAIPDASITAKSFETADSDGTVVLENQPLVKSEDADDFIVLDSESVKGFVAANAYKLDVMAGAPNRGMYNCKFEVTVGAANKLFVLGGDFVATVKVLAKIVVEDVEIGVGDRDKTAVSKMTALSFPDKMSKVLEADYHQKLVMTFNLKDVGKDELVNVHQTFIRLVHDTTGQEIFFVAEANTDDQYKFTLDVGTTGKDSFNNLSGKYRIALIVGDKSMEAPIAWTIGDVVLTFSGQPKKTKRQERITEPRPEIEHMFRVPDKRPPKVVSTAFTALVLSPLLIMFVMWAKIGANISNLQVTVPTLLFHVGLAGIFGLYYMFWVQFDMFHTLKLLMLIGGMTFLGGNKMLADMAAARYRS